MAGGVSLLHHWTTSRPNPKPAMSTRTLNTPRVVQSAIRLANEANVAGAGPG